MRIWLCSWVFILGCKAGPDDTAVVDCSDCEEAELCVAHIDESGLSDDYAACVAVPAECGEALSCSDNTCLLEAYARCDVGYVGGLCLDEEIPQLICYAEVP